MLRRARRNPEARFALATFALLALTILAGCLLVWVWLKGPTQTINGLFGRSPSHAAAAYLKAHSMQDYHQVSIVWWSSCCSTREVPSNEADAATVVVQDRTGALKWLEVYDDRDEETRMSNPWDRRWTVKHLYNRSEEVFVPEVCDCLSRLRLPASSQR
jgi:hypothetical protein